MEEEDSKKLDEPASSSQKNMDNTLPNTSNPAVFGHHYYNPQWVMYDKQTPALLYNNAVHFTVSFDGTHYFHEQYQGQFCAPPEATMVAQCLVNLWIDLLHKHARLSSAWLWCSSRFRPGPGSLSPLHFSCR
ncbi:hypothetical protein AC249_AIPGENE7240 [Exaiptasia diaphana]|nr:hypothetical protein AC249_AIPGENE7240 [Exaiptasia diaphana]